MQVLLRQWEKDDRQMLATLANNVNIWNNTRDRLPHPYTLAHADHFINHCTAQKIPNVLAILVDGTLAGCIGLELQEDVSRISAELGYWIGEPFWGKGVATAAVALMMPYVFENFPSLLRIYAKVFDYNTASMKVLEKNNFHLESIQIKSAIKNNIVVNEYTWVVLR